MTDKKRNIVLLHPDLGIGGAERLMVDLALALKKSGHKVQFMTPHHDSNHCFPETKNGSLDVTVVGAWLPRHVLGRCLALCAYIRMAFVALYLTLFSGLKPDLVICDQVSACIPVLKLGNFKIIFYCHFPDLLQTKREHFLKKVYRQPLDWLEEKTTGMADKVLVNSRFTEEVFHSTFPSIKKQPIVLYPSLDFSSFDRPITAAVKGLELKNINYLFLSINRYERKKNLNLALNALAELRKNISGPQWERTHLIMAGGYDLRVEENIHHFSELEDQAATLELNDHVTFLKSPSDDEKRALLHSCTCLLYTPSNEHFGIVPLEAMYMRRSVIACNSGGPRETVQHEQTGFLCEPTPQDFATYMKRIVDDKDLAREMGERGRERVQTHFSFTAFSNQLEQLVTNITTAH